ncbi:hypothetical protein H2200_010898 [Cladophialophora chaetospira]|uniref:Calcineurin-like phosphoesterase domain-containing protein n=1 Tax=Cladophialophora chaetospira TaxID=386627 RepID=A0AA38X118_9EURO|nr:hypothetical protein H2200_010898 [Cladophialophora chaetospira]
MLDVHNDAAPATTSPSDNEVTRLFAGSMRGKSMALALVALAFASFALLVWLKIISPLVRECASAWSALNAESAIGDVFETNKHPGTILVKTLDPDLLPRPAKEKAGSVSRTRRLVFIGDIHGCLVELEALLQKVRFNVKHDHLIALGDIVSKGPDSLGVIDLLRRYNASCVRGNHDDRLLMVARSLHSKPGKMSNGLGPKSHSDPAAEANDPVKRMAKSLSTRQLEYLQSCPIILRIGHLKAFNGDAVAVHAGIVPGLGLESQDPVSAMNLRVIDLKTHMPSHKHKLRGSVAWYKLWNRYQQLLDLHKRFCKHKGRESERHTTVVYGHNAREGLQIRKYTKGLDTGCVKGGKLTALVVDGDGKQEIVQVKARHYKHKSALQVDVLRDGGLETPASETSS